MVDRKSAVPRRNRCEGEKMNGFLPISKQDMTERGWYYCDFLLVTGDAYVDRSEERR